MLMDKITGFASVGNADSTFQWLTNDSAAWFVTGGLAYSRPELLSMFKATFSDMQQQKIEPVKSQVLVFSPTSAAWICIAKDFVEMKDGKKIAQLLSETWLWQREAGGWKVVHYNESILQMPDESVKLQVEKGLAELAASLAGKTLTPAAMPAILTAFLQKHPFVYGSTLAFAPTDADGKLHVAAPYVYRSGNEFKQTDLPEAYDYTVSEWYSVPVKTKAPAWSNPYFDAGGGGVMMITYAIPMFDKEQKLIGVLTSDLEVRQ
jgi:ketosteroid isomerase-like protein